MHQPGNNPELSIIVVSYNVRKLLLDCIQSVIDTSADIDCEIIVVDNASSDESVEAVNKEFPRVHVISNIENVGFARANNQGCEVSRGNFILLLNPDTLVKPGALKTVLEFMTATFAAGMAGCRLLNPDGTLQKSICSFPTVTQHLLQAMFLDRVIYSNHHNRTYYRREPFRIDYATGAFLMVRRKAIGQMQLLNPDFFMYAEEKDLALRLLKKGWHTYFVPSAETIHYGGQSTSQMAVEMFLELQKSQVKFFFRHYSGVYRTALVWTYWLLLCTSFIASAFLSGSAYGKFRMALFAGAVWRYPGIVRDLSCEP